MQLSKAKILSIVFGFSVAFGASFTLSKPVEASEGGDACSRSCGPAPCCMLLWVPWCGCWFDDGEQIE